MRLEGIILNWIKKELKARGFRVSAPDEGSLRVRFPKRQNQPAADIRIRIDSNAIIISCGWTRHCPRDRQAVDKIERPFPLVITRPNIPLSQPDCVKQVVCYLHQCRVHCIGEGTCAQNADRVK